MNFIIIGILVFLIAFIGRAIKEIVDVKLSVVTLGFIVLVSSFSFLALPFSLMNLSVTVFLLAGNILLAMLIFATSWIWWKKKIKIEFDGYKILKWIQQNWFVVFIIIFTIGILFIDYYPTVYSVSNTDDTTYIGGQYVKNLFNQIDATSGFMSQNISVIQRIITWKYVWMYFSNLFSIDVVIFNRFILAVIMPIVFYYGIFDGVKLLVKKPKHAQYLLVPLLIMFIYPIFSDDSWGQIYRVLYTPWFASAYSFIVYPFLVIIYLNKFKKNFFSFTSIASVCFLTIFGLMMHQVNIIILVLLSLFVLIFEVLKRILPNKFKYFLLILSSVNVVVILFNVITESYQKNQTYRLLETSILLDDIYTIIFLCTTFLLGVVYFILRFIRENAEIEKLEWIFLGINVILFVIASPILLNSFIELTGGYEFATRRILDVLIFLTYIITGCFIFEITGIRKKEKILISAAILFFLVGYAEIKYENKVIALIPKINDIRQYTYLNPLINPSRLHPLIYEVNNYFKTIEEDNTTVFGPNYIYSAAVEASLYFTPTLTLLNKDIKVVNDIRNGTVTSNQKEDLELLNNYFRCEQNICLETPLEEMVALFEKNKNHFGITHIIISSTNNDGVENPLYAYFLSNYQKVYQTKKYDFKYDFSIFEIGEK